MARNGYLERRAQHIQAATRKLSKEAANALLLLAVAELNDEFGFGAKRARRFISGLRKRVEEYKAACREDPDLTNERLRQRGEKILKCKLDIDASWI